MNDEASRSELRNEGGVNEKELQKKYEERDSSEEYFFLQSGWSRILLFISTHLCAVLLCKKHSS